MRHGFLNRGSRVSDIELPQMELGVLAGAIVRSVVATNKCFREGVSPRIDASIACVIDAAHFG
jgi:hypothetical protein